MPLQAPQTHAAPNGEASNAERDVDTRSRLLRQHNKTSISRSHFGFGGKAGGPISGSGQPSYGNGETSPRKLASPASTDTSETSSVRAGTKGLASTYEAAQVQQRPQQSQIKQQPQQPQQSETYQQPQLQQRNQQSQQLDGNEGTGVVTRSRAAQYGASSTDERMRRRRASSSSQTNPLEEKPKNQEPSKATTPGGVSRTKSTRAPPSSWASHQSETKRPSSSGTGVARSASTSRAPERPASARSNVSNPTGDKTTPSRRGSVSRKTSAATSTPQPTKPVTRSSSVRDRSAGPNATPSSKPASRPSSTAATRRDAPQTEMKPPPKPAFSTYQQRYSPTKRSASTTSTPSRPSATSSNLVGSPSVQSSNAPSIDNIREQAQLLQMSLLHAVAEPTAKAWTSSAYKTLAARFNALRQRYEDVVALERQARQHRNLLAMHKWSAGNTRALSRKLALLQVVLEELCSLTHPGDHRSGQDRYLSTPSSSAGRYTYVVAQFSTWAAWVKSVWSQRDLEQSLSTAPHLRNDYRDGSSDSTLLTPPSSRDTNSAPIWTPHRMQKYTPIEGLGDATKSELRSLGRILDALAVKLEHAAQPAIPKVVEPVIHGVNDVMGDTPGKNSHKNSLVEVESSVSIALRLTQTLLKGMQEEVQLLREVEFEVVAGEKAWVDEILKSMDGA